MAFSVYVVTRFNGVKHRQYLNTFQTQDEATGVVWAALGDRDAIYAIIQDSAGASVFFLRRPTYDPQPIDPNRRSPPPF